MQLTLSVFISVLSSPGGEISTAGQKSSKLSLLQQIEVLDDGAKNFKSKKC
jgi:hypothetical protein